VRFLKFAVVTFLAVSLVACGGNQQDKQAEEMKKVSFATNYTVELQDGSKIFSPDSQTVTGNTGKITVKNTLDAPHGFKISELGIEEVIESNSSRTIPVDSVDPGEYTVDWQLHSAHKHGKLIVKAP